jgi:hypothetical protein
MWVFAEIVNVGLPVERPDAAILQAADWDTLQEARRIWMDGEQQTRSRVDAVASARVASRHSSKVPDDLHYWYWIRLRSAQKLARMIVPYDHTQTIFGISAAMTKPKMLRWVLISWWADGGVEDWCNEWQDIADEFGRSQN